MISSTSSRFSSSVPSSQQTASAIQMYKPVTEELLSNSSFPFTPRQSITQSQPSYLLNCCKDPFLSLHLDLHLIQVAIVFQLDLCSRLLTDLPVSSFLFHPSSNQYLECSFKDPNLTFSLSLTPQWLPIVL